MNQRAAILIVVALMVTSATAVRPDGAPSLAIFTSPMVDCPVPPPYYGPAPNSCVNSFYVRWAETAGIRVVPLPWDAPYEEQETIAKSVNGILFAGGSLDAAPDTYDRFFANAQKIYNLAAKWNDINDAKFVLWGTCQGFQLLSALGAGSLNVIENGVFQGVMYRMLPLNLTAAANTSSFFSTMPANVYTDITTKDTTLNMHHDGISPKSYNASSSLANAFVPLATNTDDNGREFVSMMQAKSASRPFFGVQYHPEWPPYDWADNRYSKTESTMDVSRWAARFLAERLRENANRWSTPQALEAAVIEQHAMEYRGWGSERYWIGVPAGTNLKGGAGPAPSTASCGGKEVASGVVGALIGAMCAVMVSYYLFVVRGIAKASRSTPQYNEVS